MSPTAERRDKPGPSPWRGRDWPWRGRKWPAALLVVVLVAAAALLYFIIGPGATTAVPKVVGSTTLVAERALARAHLDTKVVKSFDETVRAGVVLLGDPPAGRQVSRGSTVTLTVSQGPERYAVPQLVGHTQAEAEQMITATRLTVGSVSMAFNESVPQGQVISTSPAADTSVKRDAAVSLVVSNGRQPIQIADWTGQPVDQAVKALTEAKLAVDAAGRSWSDTVPKGAVISQAPSSGTLFQGGLVTLVVSKGPKLVTVPDVIGRQERPARSILEALGFKVKVQRAFGGFFGTVRLQSVDGGTKAPQGSTITLTVV